MTDHWLDDMLPSSHSNGRGVFERLVDPPRVIEHKDDPGKPLYGPDDMPQRNPPKSYIEYVEPLTKSQCKPAQIDDMHMEEHFKSGGIQVYSGDAAWPLHMEYTDIDLEDIAHALAMKVRFTGHCTEDYKIAQHSCHVHDLVPVEDRREALLHDASEYVLPDVASPVKPHLQGFKPLEKRVETIIAGRFKLRFPFPPSIKAADNAMVLFERTKILKPAKYPWMVWTVPGEPANIPDFEVWSWQKAKEEFLKRAHALGIK